MSNIHNDPIYEQIYSRQTGEGFVERCGQYRDLAVFLGGVARETAVGACEVVADWAVHTPLGKYVVSAFTRNSEAPSN